MNLKKAITPDCICLALKGRTKNDVIEELIDVLDQADKLKNRKAALKAVMEREKKMSTGMQHGIAIPHGKTDAVEGLVAAIGLIPEGIDFEALDGEPSQIFILTLSPANRQGPHIQFLGEINRVLTDEGNRGCLLAAQTADEIHEIIINSED